MHVFYVCVFRCVVIFDLRICHPPLDQDASTITWIITETHIKGQRCIQVLRGCRLFFGSVANHAHHRQLMLSSSRSAAETHPQYVVMTYTTRRLHISAMWLRYEHASKSLSSLLLIWIYLLRRRWWDGWRNCLQWLLGSLRTARAMMMTADALCPGRRRWMAGFMALVVPILPAQKKKKNTSRLRVDRFGLSLLYWSSSQLPRSWCMAWQEGDLVEGWGQIEEEEEGWREGRERKRRGRGRARWERRGRKEERATSSGRTRLQAKSQKIDTCEWVDACWISPRHSRDPLVNTASSPQRCSHQSQRSRCCVHTYTLSVSKCRSGRETTVPLVRLKTSISAFVVPSPDNFAFSTFTVETRPHCHAPPPHTRCAWSMCKHMLTDIHSAVWWCTICFSRSPPCELLGRISPSNPAPHVTLNDLLPSPLPPPLKELWPFSPRAYKITLETVTLYCS